MLDAAPWLSYGQEWRKAIGCIGLDMPPGYCFKHL
jgi:hypothetical protein